MNQLNMMEFNVFNSFSNVMKAILWTSGSCWSQQNTVTASVNPHLPNGLFHPYQLDESIFSFKGCLMYCFIFILFRIGIPVSKQ